MTRRINKVAILGSGVMGSGIACHFANIGLDVLLIDIVPASLTAEEEARGMSMNDKAVRNRIVNNALAAALKSKPSPLYKASFARRIKTGNFDDDLPLIKNCDWVIEVVVERLDIKQQVFERIDALRSKGSIISSNTSGISINKMAEGRSEDFRRHFCGTHFFNPPRYLQLFEIIPGADTSAEVISFLSDYASRFLGKVTVLARDTPAFIANRVGTFSIMHLFNNVEKYGLSIPEIDKLTGPVIGRAKSATFRTADIVGLDTLVHVAKNIADLTDDESKQVFAIPGYLNKMLENKWLGDKTGQGFFKKVVQGSEKKFLSIDFGTLEYTEAPKPKLSVLEQTKKIDSVAERIPLLLSDSGKAGAFYRSSYYALFSFVSARIPEIADAIYKVDDALSAGFGWKLGPFASWDAAGLVSSIQQMEAEGYPPARWVYDMVEAGFQRFFMTENGLKFYYDPATKQYLAIPGQEQTLSLSRLSGEKIVWKNNDTTLYDIGDGVLNIAFHTKMNTDRKSVV